jgi:hypothetical protein
MLARVFSKSRVDRASRSSLVTRRVSPGSRDARHLANAALSVFVPDTALCGRHSAVPGRVSFTLYVNAFRSLCNVTSRFACSLSAIGNERK